MKKQVPVTKNQKLVVTIEDLTYQGMGVAKVDGYPLFIDGALVGEEVEVHVVKVGKNFGFAKVTNYLKTSPDRAFDVDKVYLQTGIAPLQHLTYPAQLEFKRKLVVDLLNKVHLNNLTVAPTMGMKDPYHYRNKAQVPVREVNGQLEIGFFKRNSHDFMPLEDFLIQDEKIDETLLKVRDILRVSGVSAYDEANNTGMIRHLMVRRGYYSHEIMVVLVTRVKKVPNLDQIVYLIQQQCPEVTSIMQNINPDKTNVILGKKTIKLAGKATIQDTLNDLKFDISAQSFYQVNPQQTEKLYNEAIKKAQLTGNETVIDAYCGIGTISLNMAKHAKKVYGVEIVPEAIEDAKHNASLNNLDNLEFEVGEAETWMANWQKAGIKPDVIMVDPPRKGLTTSLIESATAMEPKKIVYVSCNPATLVRDITEFMERGYHVTQPIQPVDQFPQTTHVESVTVLERTQND
ncbi:23S rRNA (uracil(1939)-C(5))-methyltransferase RlmD [Ligilactobacillus hayakitensis]|nr:23S rRNA (uracil(1939)-C(5))-methyltransferase RlmD [Ligilactobacillus hayakitensis]